MAQKTVTHVIVEEPDNHKNIGIATATDLVRLATDT